MGRTIYVHMLIVGFWELRGPACGLRLMITLIGAARPRFETGTLGTFPRGAESYSLVRHPLLGKGGAVGPGGYLPPCPLME